MCARITWRVYNAGKIVCNEFKKKGFFNLIFRSAILYLFIIHMYVIVCVWYTVHL